MELIRPNVKFKDSFYEAATELVGHKGSTEGHLTIDELTSEEVFFDHVKRKLDFEHNPDLPEGYVNETTFWIIENGEYAGRISVRHRLTPKLETYGGHIGYIIRPKFRKRGLATKALTEILKYTKEELRITKVLLTTDEDNVASQKVITANGGVRDKSLDDQIEKIRFWIEL
ncbi:MAG: GNAT family N-acetyltransferase [Deltaproteobacteria bacterium]|nr:MAG: GNAT family N-acetyltransferase [Deltaproteobacteria bacterium]